MLGIRYSTVLDETTTPAYANTSSPPAVAFEHFQFYFVADSANTTLRFTNMGIGSTNYDLVLDTVAVGAQQGPQPTFAQWKTAHFTPSQQGDSNVSGWTADPDKDGIPNGLEYFCDTDPMGGIHSSEAAALTRASLQTDNGSHY